MANIIEVEDLFFTYKDGTRALNGISLNIEEGARVAMLGPNGAGKSTLLLHLNGILLPQKGSVRLLGQEINRRNEKWARNIVGLVFQDPDDQVFSSTVWDDVAFGPVNMRLAPDEIERRVEMSLAAVNMEEYRDKLPYRLSCGQKKRVAIAGVLAMNPRVVVLDEPVGSLDPAGQQILMDILGRLNDCGTTVIIATHDVDLAASWARQVLVIKDGRILAGGGPEVLADEKVIGEAGLRLPLIAQVFNLLPEMNLDHVPLTVEEAVLLLKNITRKE